MTPGDRPTREDHPFDTAFAAHDFAEVLAVDPWSHVAEDKRDRLLACLRLHSRIRRFERLEVVVREGDYGGSAFFVLDGAVRVVVERQPGGLAPEQERRPRGERKGVLASLKGLLRRRPVRPVESRASTQWTTGHERYVPIVLNELEVDLGADRTARLEAGELFGEIAALGRTPRTATVYAEDEGTRLLEIRWQGLRDLRRVFPELGEHVDERFRARALRQHLRATPEFRRVGDTPGVRRALADGDLVRLFRDGLAMEPPDERLRRAATEAAGEDGAGADSDDGHATALPPHEPLAVSRGAGGAAELVVHRTRAPLPDDEPGRLALLDAFEARAGCPAVLVSTPPGEPPSWLARFVEPDTDGAGRPVWLHAADDPDVLLPELLHPLALDEVARRAVFRSYGRFEWARMKTNPEEEPVVAAEGDAPEGVLLLRCGFARLSQRAGAQERTVGYFGPGQAFGIEEIAHTARDPGRPATLRRTLRALGYVDVVLIPTEVVETFVLPSLAGPEIAPVQAVEEPAAGHGLLDFIVDHRLNNGTQAMLIDMERCTRCDDCVRACAATHEGNPRFVRHGPIHDGVMVASACMHCADPTCMIACPTGAIARQLVGGEVVIDEDTCIGCSACAVNCPYDDIRMVEMVVDEGGRALPKATKCDLCVEESAGPACVRACAHEALARVDLNLADRLDGFFGR